MFFEEWDDPIISAITWVSELIEIAGGRDIFADRLANGAGAAARDRIVDPSEIASRDPERYIASWCGKPFERERAVSRPQLRTTSAVVHGHVAEMDPAIILQPGPAALTDGLARLEALIHPGTAKSRELGDGKESVSTRDPVHGRRA